MFKITLRKQSPLALHCLDMPPKDRNAELIRLADLGLAIERLGIGGAINARQEPHNVTHSKVVNASPISKPSILGKTQDKGELSSILPSETVDFGDDLIQVGT